jgi:hypothetical protein
MGKRGPNAFKHNDGIRALRVARDGGMEPGALEIVVNPDGAVVFRVFGEKAAGLMGVTPETAAGAREWESELKATPKRRRAP